MPPSCVSSNGRVNDGNFIEHPISKFDTLAGVAIKYGVEVSDLKRLNCLASDVQMFALKTLRIPLPGRHPPSSQTTSGGIKVEKEAKFENSFLFMDNKGRTQLGESLNISANAFQNTVKEVEMLISNVKEETSESLTERLLYKGVSSSEPSLGEGGERSMEKYVRRRQKGEGNSLTPEKVMKEEVSPVAGQRSSIRGKSGVKGDQWSNAVTVGLGDSFITDGFSVRKSSSTSNLDEQESSNSSMWVTPKWNLKQDLHTLSSVGINIPIFDALPKPISGRKTKAALD